VATFETLFPLVKTPGIYLVEDLHTAYKTYPGGIRKFGSFVDWSRRLIDRMHAWHVRPDRLHWPFGPPATVDEFTRSAYSMTYYDSVLVIEKNVVRRPRTRVSGRFVIGKHVK